MKNLLSDSTALDFTYTYEGQTLIYTILDEMAKTCKLKGFYVPDGEKFLQPENYVSGNLVIPSEAGNGQNFYKVTKIGTAAFDGCSGLTSIHIPDSITAIYCWAFQNCKDLTSVHIPDSVKYIDSWAFTDCSSLISVHLPDGVMNIERGSFSGCNSLTSVHLPDSVTIISEGAFEDCKSLTSIHIPDSVKYIDSWAFQDCSGLTSVHIPDSVTNIGISAFEGCNDCEFSVYSLKTIPPNVNVFDINYKKATLYVPKEAVKAYKKAHPWKLFRDIRGI